MSCFVWWAYAGFNMKALAAAALGIHWRNVMVMLHEVMLWLCYGFIMVMLWLLLWLRRQPAERLRYGYCARQESKPVCRSHGSSSLLPASVGALPTLGSANSANSVNREITGVRYKISNTGGRVGTQLKQLSMQAQTSPWGLCHLLLGRWFYYVWMWCSLSLIWTLETCLSQLFPSP